MNLDLFKKQEENNKKVQTSEKHPTIPVMTLMAESDGKRVSKMIRFNIKAMSQLNIGTIGREDYNKVILFDNYLVSSSTEEDRYDLCLFVTDQKVIRTTRNNKTYDVSMGTRQCMSSEIYDAIVERFNLDTTVNNYIQLIPTDPRTGGGYSLSLITENEENKTVNLFDKGEDVIIEETQFN